MFTEGNLQLGGRGRWRPVVHQVVAGCSESVDVISPGLHRRVELLTEHCSCGRVASAHPETRGRKLVTSQCQLFTGPTMHRLAASSSSVRSHGRLATKQAFPLKAGTQRSGEHRAAFVTAEEVECLNRDSCSFPTPAAYKRSTHHRSSFYHPHPPGPPGPPGPESEPEPEPESESGCCWFYSCRLVLVAPPTSLFGDIHPQTADTADGTSGNLWKQTLSRWTQPSPAHSWGIDPRLLAQEAQSRLGRASLSFLSVLWYRTHTAAVVSFWVSARCRQFGAPVCFVSNKDVRCIGREWWWGVGGG